MVTEPIGRKGHMSIEVEGLGQDSHEMDHLYANLQFIRERRKVSYQSLALRAEMTERNCYMIVTGKQGARISTLVKLAEALEVPVSDLWLDPERFAKRYARAAPLAPLVVIRGTGKRVRPVVTKDSPFCKPLAAAS